MMPTIRILALTFMVFEGFSQIQDTAFVSEARKQSIAQYKETIKGQTFLYSGSEYKSSPTKDDQHPFFIYDDWVFGSVLYHGHRYSNIPLLYDIMTDALVTENYYNAQEIVLVREKVEAFTLGTLEFKKLREDDYNGSIPSTGYYEVIYDGPTQVIAKHLKVQENRIESQRVIIEYNDVDRYYVLKHGRFFPVRGKRSLLKVLGDQKPALRQFTRKHGLFFRNDRPGFLKKVASHYDTLTDPQQ